MNKDLAREIIRVAFRSGRELETLVKPLKEQCAGDEYRDWMRHVAMAIDGIHVALVDKALARFPELEGELDAALPRTSPKP
jgi:hypothetical protein